MPTASKIGKCPLHYISSFCQVFLSALKWAGLYIARTLHEWNGVAAGAIVEFCRETLIPLMWLIVRSAEDLDFVPARAPDAYYLHLYEFFARSQHPRLQRYNNSSKRALKQHRQSICMVLCDSRNKLLWLFYPWKVFSNLSHQFSERKQYKNNIIVTHIRHYLQYWLRTIEIYHLCFID